MNEEIVEILKRKNILSARTGLPKKGKEKCFERVKKLINLHPEDEEWCRNVAETAFTPNYQNSSFLDMCQEKEIVDDDYIPIDEEVYDELRGNWDEEIYTSFPIKDLRSFFDENTPDSTLPEPKFFNDDSECW